MIIEQSLNPHVFIKAIEALIHSGERDAKCQSPYWVNSHSPREEDLSGVFKFCSTTSS